LGREEKARTVEKLAGWFVTPMPVETVGRAMVNDMVKTAATSEVAAAASPSASTGKVSISTTRRFLRLRAKKRRRAVEKKRKKKTEETERKKLRPNQRKGNGKKIDFCFSAVFFLMRLA